MDLNVRIQKSLILDFDLDSAKQSALEDWKIDVERELIDKQDGKPVEEIKEDENEDQQDDLPEDKEGEKIQTKVENQPLENIKEAEEKSFI